MKRAYMTIDDGPSEDRIKKVDTLDKYGIQAIWFSIGEDIEKNADLAVYTVKHGHIIGNHSYSHARFSDLSLDECLNEIEKNDIIIDNIYKAAGEKRKLKAFRFPYGNNGIEKEFYNFSYSEEEEKKVNEIQKFLRSLGYFSYEYENINYNYFRNFASKKYSDWLWTYDTMEWCVFQENHPFGVRTLDDVIEMMELDLPERWMGLNYSESNEIIVIHDHPQTTDMFEPIVKSLVDRKIEFIRYI